MFDWINSTVVSAVAKYLLGILGAYIVAHGFDATSWQTISGELLALLGTLFTASAAQSHAVVKAAVAASGNVVAGKSVTTASLVSMTANPMK